VPPRREQHLSAAINGNNRGRCRNFMSTPKVALCYQTELGLRCNSALLTTNSLHWTLHHNIQHEAPRGQQRMSAILSRARLGSRVSLIEYNVEEQENRPRRCLQDEHIGQSCRHRRSLQRPRQEFCQIMSGKPHSRVLRGPTRLPPQTRMQTASPTRPTI
jgi:hypothetical protein